MVRRVQGKDDFPIFGADSQLETLLNLPMSPNSFKADPSDLKYASSRSRAKPTVTYEVRPLPPSLKRLSIAAKSTSACPHEFESAGLDLAAVTARLPQLQSLTVTAQCFFSEVVFPPESLPALRHLHVCGARVPEALLSRLPVLETASWAATVLASEDSNRPAAARPSRDFLPGGPSDYRFGVNKRLLLSDVGEAEYACYGSDGVTTYIRPSLVAPAAQPRFAAWARAARKVRLTSVLVGDDGHGSGVARGVEYPHVADLLRMCEGPCEQLELVFQCTGMGHDEDAVDLVNSWERALAAPPVATYFRVSREQGDVVAAPPGTSWSTTLRVTRFAKCPERAPAQGAAIPLELALACL